MIRFERVAKRYPPGIDALRALDLEINRGELVYLTGHSGAGKSTLLKLILLLERPSAGRIYIGGENINQLPDHRIAYYRRHIGAVFQNHRLLTDRTLFDNVALPLWVAGVNPNEIGKRVRAALDLVGLLDREKANPAVLSSGQQQRAGIARAMVNKPSILIADEPTGNLDPQLSIDMMNLFERINQTGTTMIIATHEQALIDQLPGRKLHLNKGKIVTPSMAEVDYV